MYPCNTPAPLGPWPRPLGRGRATVATWFRSRRVLVLFGIATGGVPKATQGMSPSQLRRLKARAPEPFPLSRASPFPLSFSRPLGASVGFGVPPPC
ncbi:hypothetical protein Taro_003338 [Colocasia esculenta]|uniref:Uncharacterized protein n=1 Tax=Colocasia esculenta TaxID=4460 RepID=A0A843TF50_COLES|nr:hypothetical protein [Colocasia esculenta]